MRTKKDYLMELKKELLKVLPREEAINALNYFEEYIEEANLTQYDEIVLKLGSAKEVSFNAIIDYQEVQLENNPTKAKMNWLLPISLLLSAPLSLPLIFIAITFLFVGILMLAIVVFMIYLIDALLWFIGGIFTIISIFTITQHIPTGLFHMGIGLIVLAIAWMVTPILITISKKITVGTYKKILTKLRSKSKKEVSYVE